MEINLTPEQESRLIQIAQHEGMEASDYLLKHALNSVDEDARFLAAVQEGIRQADAGNFIEEDEMDARVARMLQR